VLIADEQMSPQLRQLPSHYGLNVQAFIEVLVSQRREHKPQGRSPGTNEYVLDFLKEASFG